MLSAVDQSARAPPPSLAMMVRLACPGAWPRVVGAPLPPSPGITIALAAVLGKPLAVHRLPHGRPAHDPAGEGFGAFAPLVAWLAPLLSETPEAYAGDGGKERHAMVACKSASPKRGVQDGPNIARSRQVASAAVAASTKRPACQPLGMPLKRKLINYLLVLSMENH